MNSLPRCVAALFVLTIVGCAADPSPASSNCDGTSATAPQKFTVQAGRWRVCDSRENTDGDIYVLSVDGDTVTMVPAHETNRIVAWGATMTGPVDPNSREWTPQPVEETFTKKFVATFNSAGDRFAGSTGYGSIEAQVEDGVYHCPASR